MASFNPNELEIMKILWEEGPLKPSEIQERLSSPIKNSALRWQLGALVDKGQVRRRKRGKAYFYRAATPQRSVLRKLTRRLADVFCEGSAVALIGQMIESEEKLSEEDIRELRRIASKRVSSGRPSQKKGEQK